MHRSTRSPSHALVSLILRNRSLFASITEARARSELEAGVPAFLLTPHLRLILLTGCALGLEESKSNTSFPLLQSNRTMRLVLRRSALH